ncbi:MAG: NrfD/PsrC family molybdoenzyme membrane anchor subunit [Gemmatimonadales bacterium]
MSATAVPEKAATAGRTLTYDYVTRAIAATLGNPGKLYYLSLAFCVAGVGAGLFALLWMIRYGFGSLGLTHPVMWGVLITNFVFWVGIAHSGTLISAILYLFRSGWRTAVYRAAEAMTVFAVMTAGLFPLIHIGRQWYFFYLIPYPNERGLWPNFKSPLVWDEFAIGTYFTVSTCFLIMGLIPDIAAARDLASGWRKKLYTLTSLGWQGTHEQWRHFTRAYLYLAALATPLVLSVHSVVSWDFAMAIVPGWHTTIFAPYFVAGAIYSGVAMVISIVVPLRKFFRMEDIITVHHFENLAKLCLLTGSIVGYAYAVEYFIAWYSGNAFERAAFVNRAFGDYWWASWTMIICNAFLPQLLWFKKIRTNITALFVLSIFVNIGMWFERFVIIVVSLSHEYEPYAWGHYTPQWPEWMLLFASFCWFFMWFLLFARNFPTVSITEVKEVLPPPRRGKGGH